MSSAMRHQAPVHAGWAISPAQNPSLSTLVPSSAAAPASQSQPDSLALSDLPTTAPAIKRQRPPLSVIPVPRSSSLAALMGQSQARPTPPLSPVATSALGIAATATGHKLKRALGVRRKRSEDVAPSPLISSHYDEKVEGRDSDASSRSPLSARQLASHLHVFGGRKAAKSPSSPLPPPPPPKTAVKKTPSSSSRTSANNQRASIIPLSPSISSAVHYMRKSEDEERERETGVIVEDKEKENREKEPETSDLRDDWRKSDSTMTARAASHRNSRPVSMADSLQSTHTIVPSNKRLSFGYTDTANSPDSQPEQVASSSTSITATHQTPSLSAIKAQNRRSFLLNPSSAPPSPLSPTTPSYLDVKHTSPAAMLTSEGITKSPSTSTDSPTLTMAAASGFITPSNQPTSKNIRGRLAAWTATSNAASIPVQFQPRSVPTPDRHQSSPFVRPAALSQPRQTAMSFTSSLGPAAGLAKRAVEKMGRALGGITSSSSSGYSSASTTSSPTSQSSSYTSGHTLSRDNSRQSVVAAIFKPSRKTPNAPSGAWSVASSVVSSSAPDLDAFLTPDGPNLGKQLRGPLRLTSSGAGVAGGLVFGRDLRTCCRETAITIGRYLRPANAQFHNADGAVLGEVKFFKALETRLVPAIVVRCAQHLLLWGVHEEGLFRVNGRPFHVSKLRSEFDTGSDYDMSECDPGELDPHAVASVFKAYLRELPEPILTRALLSQFDAAVTAESNTTNQKGSILGRGLKPGPSLPTGPRTGLTMLKKPPSLSTLSMPNFSSSKPPSRSLVNALRSLIQRLPQENRDLLRIVTELIKVTAKHSKETKMPLGNLLLVFCPSLNMNPPLLRALCECESIWEDAPSSPVVEPSAGISTPRPSDAGTDRSQKKADPSPQREANATEEASKDYQLAREHPTLRARVIERSAPIPTIYLDSESCASSSDIAVRSGADSMSSRDDVSYVSTREEPMKNSSPVSLDASHTDGPPPISPSTESLATPSSSYSHLPIPTDPYSKRQATPGSPTIADPTNLPLAPRKPTISSPITSPVQFPLTGPIPQPPSPMARRRSVPILSLPTFSVQSEDSKPDSPSANRTKRPKKPSLNLLFAKPVASIPSATSLISFSPYLHGWSASESSTSTPTSAVTARSRNSATNLAPVLNTPIDESPLGLDLPENDGEGHNEGGRRPGSRISQKPSTSDGSSARGTTPIADLYLRSSVSMQSLSSLNAPSVLRMQQQPPPRPDISLASASSHSLGEPLKTDDGDWTQSVLLAANKDFGWLSRRSGEIASAPVHTL